LKGILSELSEQALRFIKNSFQTTALTWILSLGKKLIKREQHDENLFSIILPSVKLFGEAKKAIRV